ncbi:hypothetical protein QBC43DRAFT_285838 [Cladorrhinum sp. PSN259]|nr:hypothetical protein QBC43DRAFT_285838 [Cladorrhinum sp. PSN259]
MRFMSCTPTELFEGRLLEFDPAENAVDTKEFFEKLRLLVVHPFCHTSRSFLAIVMQYAVKLRTGDRRMWPIRHHSGDKFLDEMATQFSQPPPWRATD